MACFSEVGGNAAGTATSYHESSHWTALGAHADAVLVAGSALPACFAGLRRRNPIYQGVRRRVWALTPHAALRVARTSSWRPHLEGDSSFFSSGSSRCRRSPSLPPTAPLRDAASAEAQASSDHDVGPRAALSDLRGGLRVARP